MRNQCCRTCTFYDSESIAAGLCRHPITELMRDLTRNHMVPFAFSELEVTTLGPTAGSDCSTWKAKP